MNSHDDRQRFPLQPAEEDPPLESQPLESQLLESQPLSWGPEDSQRPPEEPEVPPAQESQNTLEDDTLKEPAAKPGSETDTVQGTSSEPTLASTSTQPASEQQGHAAHGTPSKPTLAPTPTQPASEQPDQTQQQGHTAQGTPSKPTLAPTPTQPASEQPDQTQQTQATPASGPPAQQTAQTKPRFVVTSSNNCSEAAVDRRLRRLMRPLANGTYRVSETIRQQWETPGSPRKRVEKLFAECGNDAHPFLEYSPFPVLLSAPHVDLLE